MKLNIAVVSAVLILGAAALGTAAFTTASVDRTTSLDVVDDTQGLIALDASPDASGLVTDGSDGQLSIDFTQGGAGGANVNAQFTIGDNSTFDHTTTADYAFTITNQDTASHSFSIDYTGVTEASSGTDNLKFVVYDDADTLQTIVTEESGSQSLSIGSGSTVYVVMVVDTTSYSDNDGNDLSGTLEISA